MIVVMGATGNTGRKIAHALLETGETVRALARSESALAELAHAGAEVCGGDAADVRFLTDAFRGADAVYTLLPTDRRSPDYFAAQRQQGEAIVGAISDSGVRHVVALSSLGADLGEGTGLIEGLHAQEERLRQLAAPKPEGRRQERVSVLLLRPVSFFENFYESLGLIKQQGIIADSVAPDLAIPMIASRDIAEAAARALVTRNWTGVVVRELLGQRDLSYAEATRIIGERIGRPGLAYVQLPYGEMAGALVEAGLSHTFADLYVAMTRAFNEGRARPQAGRTPENTTPTQFEDFAPDLARALRLMS